MDENGGNVCNVCGKKLELHLEHDHKWKYVKIKSLRNYRDFDWKKWIVVAEYKNKTWFTSADKKNLAIKAMRKILQRESVRGRCCWPCNRLIRFAYDDPVRLRKAAEYLERWNGKEPS